MVFSTLKNYQMKKIFLAISCLYILTSCYKNQHETLVPVSSATSAYVKFINVVTNGLPTTVPALDVFINNNKINAAAIGYGSIFPIPNAYASIPGGVDVGVNVTINGALGNFTNGSFVGGTGNFNIGSYTSFFVVDDTLPKENAGNPVVVAINEVITNAPINTYKMRFVNMIPTTDTLEVFSKNLQQVVLPATKFKRVSNWVTLPQTKLDDTLQLRKINTTRVLGELRPFKPTSERVYTIYSRGRYSDSVGVRARTLTSYVNQ
jgi:hypothetical protein